jgi:hypothetical protein
VTDEFEDESGVDTAKCINQLYDAGGDYYSSAMKSQYPPLQDDDHVKVTSKGSTSYWPFYATDPTKSLVGDVIGNAWLSATNQITNQRFHIDLGSGKIITRIYYENGHVSGNDSDSGIKTFTFLGSNAAGDFADLTYANDGTWVPLTTSQGTFDQHVAANQADPKYITVTNTVAYRYYAIKIADKWGSATTYMHVRRIELQLGGMTLVSDSVEAVDQPTNARFLALVEPVDAATPNTDVKGWVSEDDDAHYDQVVLADLGVVSGDIKIYAGSVTLTDRSDKTMRMKLTVLNDKNVKVHQWTLQWGG